MPVTACNKYRLPKISTLAFLTTFVIIIPYILEKNNYNKYIRLYLLYLLPISYLISRLDIGLLDDLYTFDISKENIRQYKFTYVINIITLFAILYNGFTYSSKYGFKIGLIYAIFLFLIKIPLTKLVINKLYKLLKKKEYKSDKNKLKDNVIFMSAGIFYIIILSFVHLSFGIIVRMWFKNKK